MRHLLVFATLQHFWACLIVISGGVPLAFTPSVAVNGLDAAAAQLGPYIRQS